VVFDAPPHATLFDLFIIAVKDIEVSSNWYQSIFNWKSLHGGKKIDVLVAEK
jgi:hypothetical protein